MFMHTLRVTVTFSTQVQNATLTRTILLPIDITVLEIDRIEEC